MERKPLCLVSAHNYIAERDKILEELKVNLDEIAEDCRHEVAKIQDVYLNRGTTEWEKIGKPAWDEITAYMVENKLLPDDFDESKYGLGIGQGVVWMHEKGDEDDFDIREMVAEVKEMAKKYAKGKDL